jgi:hypothetical protein
MASQAPKVLPTPVDFDELYPGRFLKASEFKGKQVTLRIAGVQVEELVGDKGPQVKGIVSFERTEKSLCLNKTNGLCLKEMFGKKVQEWIGKRVTLFPALHDGEPCIRVWGSPELDRDRDITIALPRKRPFTMTMHKTGTGKAPVAGNGKATQAPPPPASEREPGVDDEYDPVLSRELDKQLANEE